VSVKGLHHLGKVRQGAGKPIYLIDDHHIDQTFADIGQQSLQGRTLHSSARQTSVVVCGLDQAPALAGLTFDEGLARLALRDDLGVAPLTRPG
jgi:hypothetical protein